jgi:malonyl-CoA O-methyltransferase
MIFNECGWKIMKYRFDFSRAAKNYNSFANLQKEVAQKLSSLANAINYPALDLGCGTGYLGESLQIYPFDISHEMCKIAFKEQNHQAICGDAHFLPFLDNSFRGCISSLMLQWCDLSLIFSEVKRILQEKGDFYFSSFVSPTLAEQIEIFGQNRFMQFHSQEYYQKTAIQHGFEIISWKIEEKTTNYPDMRAFLRSFSQIGANISAKNSPMRKDLLSKKDIAAKWFVIYAHIRA